MMPVAYFYFMKPEPDRVRTVAPRHAAYWQGLALPGYRGGPFADRSGGLILFDSNSTHEVEEVVARDPFVSERLLKRHWVKQCPRPLRALLELRATTASKRRRTPPIFDLYCS